MIFIVGLARDVCGGVILVVSTGCAAGFSADSPTDDGLTGCAKSVVVGDEGVACDAVCPGAISFSSFRESFASTVASFLI